MSTIAIANGHIAADTRAYSGGVDPIGQKLKISKTIAGLVGVSTNEPGLAEAFAEWLGQGGAQEDCPRGTNAHFSALQVTPSGQVFYYGNDMRRSGPLMGDFHAIGSGAAYALGALEAGAELEEALSIACKLDIYSEGPLQIVKIPNPQKEIS